MAHTQVTNGGGTKVNGDLGLSPGTLVTGFPPGEVIGTKHITNSAAAACMSDLGFAITNANGRAANQLMSGEIGGMTLSPGVYKSDGGFGITNTLTLDGQNDPVAAWIFIMASTLVVNSGAKVVMINYDDSAGVNVWWSCGTHADIFTTAILKGTVMAHTSVAAQDGASTGPLLASTGQVALMNNVVQSYEFGLYDSPTSQPSGQPSRQPSSIPTFISVAPIIAPTPTPTMVPSVAPTVRATTPGQGRYKVSMAVEQV